MSPVPRLSTEDRVRVVVLHEEGYSCNMIALRLKVARCTVQQIVKKHKETSSVEDRKGRGRKRITTCREDRLIVKESLKARKKTSRILANELRNDHNIKVSSRTVRRRLLASGLKYCRSKKKPLLSAKARVKRLDWGKQHRDYDWSKVVFSDESRFCLISDRPVYIRRRSGEEYLPQCLSSTVKHGGGGIMVWGCISTGGVGSKHRVHGTLNAAQYIKILKFCAQPSIKHYFKDGDGIYQQDNAPCHTANTVKEWMRDNKMALLPGNSPDMNPIEHIWDYIGNIKFKSAHLKMQMNCLTRLSLNGAKSPWIIYSPFIKV